MNKMNIFSKFNKIVAINIPEEDIVGKLLEKYNPGTIYDEKEKIWIVPENIEKKIKEINNSPNNKYS